MSKYTCKLCHREFNRWYDSVRHNRRKNPCIKNLKCNKCDIIFSRIDALKRHINNSECLNFDIEEITDIVKIDEIATIDKFEKTNKLSKENNKLPKENVIKLNPIYNLSHAHIKINEIKKAISSVDKSPILFLNDKPYIELNIDIVLNLHKLVFNNENNKVLFKNKDILYMYDGSWNESRMTKSVLTDILRYIFHAAESRILKDDPVGDSKIYNDLTMLRTENNINTMIKNHRSEIKNLIPTTTKVYTSKSDKNKKSDKKKKSNNILYSPESKKNCIIEKMHSKKEKNESDEWSEKDDMFEDLGVSPYNSDDEDFYQKSMYLFKNENKLLNVDGSISEYIPPVVDDDE